MIDSFQLIVAAAAGATVAGVVAALLAPAREWVLLRLNGFAPESRVYACAGLLCAPLIAGVATAMLVRFAADGIIVDVVHHHCHARMPDCIPHGSVPSSGLMTALAGATGAAFVAYVAMAVAAHLYRGLRTLRLLMGATSSVRQTGLAVIGGDDTMTACCLGRSRVFVGRGLLRHLTRTETKVVLRHERAHLRRRDPLVRTAVAALSVGHGRATAQALRAALVMAQEQACDRVAASYYGALRTAETLVKVERLARRGAPVPGAAALPGLLDGAIPARVHALLEPRFRAHARAYGEIAIVLLGALTTLVMLAEPLHHTFETLLLRLAV